MDLTDPLELAAGVGRALARARRPYAVCGGVALAAWGRVRQTRDADFAVSGVEPESLGELLHRAGVESKIAFAGMRFGGLTLTRSSVWMRSPPGQVNTVDWVEPRSRRYARAALRRSVIARVGKRSIRLLAPEDFVLFKVLSTRALDLEDAASAMTRNRGRLDLRRMESEIRRLAVEIRDYDVRDRWKTVCRLAPDFNEPRAGSPPAPRR